MKLLKKEKNGNRRKITILDFIKISYKRGEKRIKRSNLNPVNLSKKELIIKEKFYTNIINSLIEEIKNYKVDLNPDIKNRKKLENAKITVSQLDPLGSVFQYEGKIYRGVKPEKVNHFLDLYKTGMLQVLSKHNMVAKTKLTDFYTEEFPLIIEHEKLPIVQPFYWSYIHFKQCAINTLLINTIASHFGYHLIDGHSLNTVFLNNAPVFIDVGSFIPMDHQSSCIDEIYSHQISYLLASSFDNSLLPRVSQFNKVIQVMPRIEPKDSIEYAHYVSLFKKYHLFKSSRVYNQIINEVFSKKRALKPEHLDLLFGDNILYTTWGDYNLWGENKLNECIKEKNRFKRVVELIQTYSSDANSLIDIAGNSGFFGALADKMLNLERIFCIDYDERAVCQGYKSLNSVGARANIYLENFMYPQLNKVIIDEKVDIAVAMALTHHLILVQQFDINRIFEQFKKYAQKYVFIEFCPLGMYGGEGHDLPTVPDWYTQDWFEEKFKNHFKLLHKEVIATANTEEGEKAHRIMFVGQIDK